MTLRRAGAFGAVADRACTKIRQAGPFAEAGFDNAEHVSGATLAQRYFSARTDGLLPSSGEEFLIAPKPRGSPTAPRNPKTRMRCSEIYAVSSMRALMSLRTSAMGSGRLGSKWSADFVRLYAARSDDSVESVVPLNGKYEHPFAVARKPAITCPRYRNAGIE